MNGQSQSPWLSAIAMLDEADKKLLAFDDNNDPGARLNILDRFGQTTREAYDACVRKRWSFELPGEEGKKVIVRDLLGKITHWIEVFKSIGDQAVAFDPVHAALPWAGARFLLQIAINDFAKFNFVVEGAEKISRMTARYRIIEQVYLSRQSESAKQLQQAVIRLYATTLTYLAKAKRYFEQNTAVRLLQSGLLAKSDLHDLLDKMDVDEREADRCANLVEAEMNKDVAGQIADISLEMKEISALRDALMQTDQPILQMSIQLDRVEDHLDNLQRREILDWLSSQRYGDYHRLIKERVLDGTCGWIVQHPEFIKWKTDSTNTLLWLHGTQGAGKSCLTSVVIEDSMEIARVDTSSALAYFYCSRNTSEPQRSDPQKILACIARQLSSPSPDRPIAPPTLSLYNTLRSVDGSRESLSIQELVQLILELTDLYSRTTIAVDAMDECDPETRWKLIDALNEIVADSNSLVKVFLSSREEGDLRLSIQDHTGVQVTALEIGEDIRKFVEYETDRMVAKKQVLGRIRQQSTKEELKQLIKNDVVSKANGMFRWAEMQLASLRGIQFEKDIRAELSRIPRDLGILYENLYKRALENAKETAQAVLRNTLKWMLCSRRMLPQKDFIQAITAFLDVDVDDFDEEVILDLLSNFVVSYTTEEGVQSFRFAHLSVREFLERKPEYSIESSNSFASEASLLTLIGCSGSPSASRFIQELGLDTTTFIPFSEVESHKKGIHDYCIRYWSGHCDLAGEKNRTTDKLQLQMLLEYFLFDDSDENCPLNCWWRSYHRVLGSSSYAWNMKQFLNNHQRSCERALYIASCYGFDEIVRIDRLQEFDDHLTDECAMGAARNQRYSILKYLLDTAENSQLVERVLREMVWDGDVEGLKGFLNLLDPAQVTEEILRRARKSEIVSMLLDHNKDIQITTRIAENSFWYSDGINVYLDRAPELQITSGILENAIGNMDFDSFKRLVDRVDPAIITCEVIATAVFKRCLGAHVVPMTELLLERAGKMEVTDKAMIQVVRSDNNSQILKRLMDHGWPVTPWIVEYAVLHSNKEAFQVVFEASGGKVTSRFLEMSAANFIDGDRMVKFLVSLLKDPLDDETWSRMMVKCAHNTHRGPETVRVLLGLDTNAKVPERLFLDTLKTNWNGHGILDLVLDSDRELEITDSVVQFALEYLEYDETIRKILDRHGSEVISCNMMLGAVRSRLFGDEMTKLLLRRGSSLEHPSAEVINAVICNDHSGYEILQMLENRFGNFTFSDADLESAATSGNLSMLKLILHRQSFKQIPPAVLQAAASQAHLDVLKHLLQLNTCPVTREMVIAAAGSRGSGDEKFKLVWDHAPEVEPCPEMFLQAGKFGVYYPDNLKLLMGRLQDETLGQRVLDAAVKSSNTSCRFILGLLLEKKVPLNISYEIVMDAIESRNGDILGLVVDHTDIKITQEMVDKAVECDDINCMNFLTHYDNTDGLDLRGANEYLLNMVKKTWFRDFDVDG